MASTTAYHVVPEGAPILVVKPEWLCLILDGDKTWEIRSTSCRKKAGTVVYFSASKTGLICGRATFVKSRPIESTEAWKHGRRFHRCGDGDPPYKTCHAWEFREAVRMQEVPYRVRRGSIGWRKYEAPGE